ncbi:MAG: hypothetical protein PHT33_14275, partial [bacterium]|nr:hypothetical protein [bacterium]
MAWDFTGGLLSEEEENISSNNTWDFTGGLLTGGTPAEAKAIMPKIQLPDVGFDPEMSDPSLKYRAANPITVDNGPEVYSPEGGYIAPASGGAPLWTPEDKEKVIFQALKVPYNLGFRGGPETDVFTEP